MVNGYKRKTIQQHNIMMKQAWYAAYLPYTGEKVSLESILITDIETDSREQTTNETITMMKLLTAAYGGIVREV